MFKTVTIGTITLREYKRHTEISKKKHTVGLEPTISCSVGKRLIQLGYACYIPFSYTQFNCLALSNKHTN